MDSLYRDIPRLKAKQKTKFPTQVAGNHETICLRFVNDVRLLIFLRVFVFTHEIHKINYQESSSLSAKRVKLKTTHYQPRIARLEETMRQQVALYYQ